MKSKRNKIIVAVLATVFVALLVYYFSRPAEPTYQGKTMTQCFDQAAKLWQIDAEKNECVQAFRSFGTQAVPFLVLALERKETASEKFLTRFRPHLPSFAQKYFSRPLSDSERKETARSLIQSVGPEVRTAVARMVAPGLLEQIRNPKTPDRSMILGGYLRDLHPPAELVMKDLNNFLIDPDPRVREMAAFTILDYGKEAKPALTNLIGALSDARLWTDAVYTLGFIGDDAKLAIPALMPYLESTNKSVRVDAALAIWRIDHQTNLALKTLPEGFDIHRDTIYEVGRIGPAAIALVPTLIPLAQNSDYNVSMNACQALWKIDPTQSPVVLTSLSKMMVAPGIDPYFLQEGAKLMGRMGASSAAPDLKRLLNHEDADVRKAATNALRAIELKAAKEAGVK